MCVNPAKIPDIGFVACRKCWQCRANKINDWVGRNIAESKTAKACHVVTLTYGHDSSTGSPDHIRAVVLTYSDVQKYLKLLRVNGFPTRYFAVGEYGSKKGRAHWHIILYWQGAVPDHEVRKHFAEKHWPHGWSYWDTMTPESVRYACKYLDKETPDETMQGFGPMPSKKPPLGDAYFKRLAHRYVDAGLSPQNLHYSFPEIRKGGRPVEYLMTGTTAKNFCQYFIDSWDKKFRDLPPQSPVIDAYQAKKLAAYIESVAEPQFERRGYVPKPSKAPYPGSKVVWSETHNCYYADGDLPRLFYSYDKEGDLGWHEKIRPEVHETTPLWEKPEPSLGALYRSVKDGLS